MRTSKDEYKTKEGKIIALSQDEQRPKGSKIWNGYDYENQCWIYNGKLDTRTLAELQKAITQNPVRKSVMEVYAEVLLRAESLKNAELSGDGYLELYWVAGLLEQTKEVNPEN